MLIGEAPGRDEDAQGLPFVGRSGQLLDKMLAAINLDRTKVYIGNVIYWRPPGNRTPSTEERAMCEPFIRRQIELVRPNVMMTLGGSALSTLFEVGQGIMRTRGRILDYTEGDLVIPTVPTLHPAALLRNPLNKRLAWQDLLALQALIKQNGAV
jgi:DNA polymerase